MFGRVSRGRLLALGLLVAACASGQGRRAWLEPPNVPAVLGTQPDRETTPLLPVAGGGRARERPVGSLPLAASSASVPLIFEAAAPDASWTVLCQATADTDHDGSIEVTPGPRGELRGDRLERFIVLPNGVPERIDDLLASSLDGRFVVVRRGGRAQLGDTRSQTFSELVGLDATRERTLPARQQVRILGSVLWFVRRSGPRTEIVERALPASDERVLYSGTEQVLGIDVDPTASVVVAEIAVAGVRRLDHAVAGEAPSCASRTAEARPPRKDSNALGFLVISRTGGRARRVDDFAGAFGRQLFRRTTDGALYLDRDGQTRLLTPDVCQGRVLFAEPERNLLLLGCALPKKPWRFGVELWAGAARRALPFDVAALAIDEPARPKTRLFPLYPGADTFLFDAERQMLRRFQPGDLVLGVGVDHALIRRGRLALLYDARTDTTQPLAGELDPRSETLQTGHMVHANPFVVDLGTGSWVGNVSGQALAVALSGEVLLAAVPASAEALARGPLLWRAPERAP
jgi:hypothetical protein